MKKVISYSIFLLVLILSISSCEDNSSQIEAPTLEILSPVIDNPYLGSVSETVQFTISANIPGRFNGFSIVERKNNGDTVVFETTRITDPALSGKDQFAFDFSYQLQLLNQDITLQFILTDEAGNDVTDEWLLRAIK